MGGIVVERLRPLPVIAGFTILAVLLTTTVAGLFSDGHGNSGWTPRSTAPLSLGGIDTARPSSAASWDPGSGRSSPGAPTNLLTTLSRSNGTCNGGSGRPAWLAYDSADRSDWVASPPSCVDVIRASAHGYRMSASIRVGQDPFGVAVDNTTNDVFVSNTGSNKVSVISAATNLPIGSVVVGSEPYGVAYDWRTQDLYVANGGSDNVSVVSGATWTLLATVAVGHDPLGIAADPQTGQIFVADRGAHNVTVLSASTYAVLATIPVGTDPYGVALDNVSDEIWVTNSGSNNLSVISASSDTLQATIPVVAPFMELQGLAYDAHQGDFWVGAGSFYAVVVNASQLKVVAFSSFDPSGVTYDPDTGDVCVTNTGNNTFACLRFPGRWAHTIPVTFVESGLPVGTRWTVAINESGWNTTYGTSTARSIAFSVVYWVNVNSNVYTYATTANGYLATVRQGTISENGMPARINVTFLPLGTVFPASFREVGVPAFHPWYVNVTNTSSGVVTRLQGVGSSPGGPWLNFTLAPGNYSFTAQSPGFTTSQIRPSSATFLLTAGGYTRTVHFR